MNERPEATANAAETEPMDPKPATTAAAPAAPEPDAPAPDEPAPEAAAAEAPLDSGSDDAPADAADAEAAWQADEDDEDAVPDDAWPEEEAPARTVFADLGLSEEILRAVTESGYQHPTPIQEQAIPVVMMGRDVLGCAQTGTGKTASFVLPMLDILTGSRAKMRMPRSLILEPTRELALQVAENFEKYGKYLKLNHALLIGGESMNDQRDVLEKGVDVLIATPGRLLDLFDRGRILLADCKLLVIDEADRMLDMGFIPDVERIVSLLPKLRQTLFFSATMAPEIRRLADAFLSNPREITVAPPASVATTIKAGLVYVQPHDKREALRCLIRSEQVSNALIFCNRKVDVDILYKSLKKHGFAAGALHGDMEQSARFATLNAFKAGELQLLVCSDVAARGIDIGGLSHVFNFDVPFRDEDYVHRIGRTGRAGREGHAYSIATADDVKLVQAIEALTGKPIPRIEIDGLDPVTEEELAEAATAPRRGRGGRADARGGRRSGGRSEARPEKRGGSERRGEGRGEKRARDEAPREKPARDAAAPREERARSSSRRDDRAPRRDIEAETLREAEAPREARAPRRDAGRDDYRRDDRRRDRDRDDLGPAVQGFGDSVPAFMLIPIPRPRRESAVAEVETDAAEAA